MPRRGITVPIGVACLGLLLLASRAEARERTDVVTLRGGLRVPGEILQMTLGRLSLRTDDMGRVSIEWLRVTQIESTYPFAVEFTSGTTYFGPLHAGADGELLVGTRSVRLDEVVSITPVDDRFWNRVRAYADLGFSLAKANTALTLSADGGFDFRGEMFGTSAAFNTYVQSSEQVAATTENIAGAHRQLLLQALAGQPARRARPERRARLNLRLSLGADIAYAAIRNSFMELWLAAGLTVAREQYSGMGPDLAVAGYFDATWRAFRYASPELDTEIELSLLPVLNDLGRVRGTATGRVKYEVFSDFNVGCNLDVHLRHPPARRDRVEERLPPHGVRRVVLPPLSILARARSRTQERPAPGGAGRQRCSEPRPPLVRDDEVDALVLVAPGRRVVRRDGLVPAEADCLEPLGGDAALLHQVGLHGLGAEIGQPQVEVGAGLAARRRVRDPWRRAPRPGR